MGWRLLLLLNGKIPVSTDSPYEVKIKMLAGFTSGEIELYLGNLRKVITVRRNDMLSGVARVINRLLITGIMFPPTWKLRESYLAEIISRGRRGT